MGVLLVDDNLEDQDVVNATLNEAGFAVLFVNDGLSGLDAAIAEKPELIILDSHIMGIDVVDFVKKIRHRSHLENTPVILLTPMEENYDPLFLQSMGIQAILNKPIDPALLSQEVVSQIGQTVREDQFASNPLLSDEETGEISGGISSLHKRIDTTAIRSLEMDALLRENILEVVEKIAWEVIPGVIEAALPKEVLKSIVERVVWETVPALAEIAIKKEIQRLQPE